MHNIQPDCTDGRVYHAVIFTGCPNYMMKPLGAHKVAHELRQAGFKVLVINHADSFSNEQLVELLHRTISDKTLFVGISATFLNYAFDFENHVKPGHLNPTHSPSCGMLPQGSATDEIFARTIKKQNPKCKIVIGGVHSVRLPSRNLIDYFVRGYGDTSMVQLAKHLAYGDPITVNHFRDIQGGIVIDDGEAKTFDFNNSTMIWCEDDVMIQGEMLPLEISRGCVFKCKFCNFRLNGKKQIDYLKHMHIVEREMRENYDKYGITHYRLVDDTFNDTQEKIDAMLDIVKRLPFQPRFNAYVRLDLLTAKPHTIPQLFDMGFRAMFFGIETLNRRTGSIIGKGADPDKLIDTIKYLKHTYGDALALTGSFICGLPEESKHSVQKTMRRLISREIPLDQVMFYPLLITKPGQFVWESSIDQDTQSYGYEMVEDPRNGSMPIMNWKNAHMTFFEARAMCDNFYKLYRPITPSDTQKIFFPFDKSYVDTYHNKLWQFLNLQTFHADRETIC